MDKVKPKISIGIPAFNAEKTIEKIIKSILNQTIQDFEVIISDNASKDKTLEICKKYAKNDTRIKIFS
jgi:glycosyltransferase involved in cell wall biosynthesis